MLVECSNETNLEVDQRRSLDITEDLSQMISDTYSSDSSSSCSSLDIDLNIRQMEETQRRINMTLENLLKLRQEQVPALSYNVNTPRRQRESLPVSVGLSYGATERKRHSLETVKRSANRNCHLISDKEDNFLSEQMSDADGRSRKRDVTNNNNQQRNSYQYPAPIESPVRTRIQGLINSVKNLKNRSSVEKEDKPSVSREPKTLRTKDTFSVEDFTELMRSLPANHFPEDKTGADQVHESQQSSNKKNQTKVFHIVREMMTSEQNFVSNLSLICEDFTNFLQRSSQQVEGPDFDNLPEILQLSRELHQEFQIRFEHWEEIPKISDVFLSHRSDFKVYLHYLRNFSNMNKHFDECQSKNSEFRNLCESFEKLPACKNLKLKHFLLKPVQRLPQYKLLISDYLKHLDTEAEDYQDSDEALQMITELLKNANDVIL